jgi:hypothetical protein
MLALIGAMEVSWRLRRAAKREAAAHNTESNASAES